MFERVCWKPGNGGQIVQGTNPQEDIILLLYLFAFAEPPHILLGLHESSGLKLKGLLCFLASSWWNRSKCHETIGSGRAGSTIIVVLWTKILWLLSGNDRSSELNDGWTVVWFVLWADCVPAYHPLPPPGELPTSSFQWTAELWTGNSVEETISFPVLRFSPPILTGQKVEIEVFGAFESSSSSKSNSNYTFREYLAKVWKNSFPHKILLPARWILMIISQDTIVALRFAQRSVPG